MSRRPFWQSIIRCLRSIGHRSDFLTGALLILALMLPAAEINAQSGRQKPPSKPGASQPQRTPATRPKRVNEQDPAAQDKILVTAPKPRERVPNSPEELGDAPPLPTPKPTPTPAPTDEGEEVSPEDVVRVNSNLVTVPASVMDTQGRAVTDLKLEDFELRVDGQPKPISELGFADSPVRMALLFDNSSSLVAAREFEKQAATRFFKRVLRPIDQAMIFSISTIPTLEQPLTNNVQTLVRTIERFQKPEGATALFDTLVQAALFLKPHTEGRKVIVIVSDGADTISDLDFDSTLKRVLAADCQVYVVQTGYLENANLRDLAAERRMQEFASQSGGAVYIPRNTDDLDNAFAQISSDLSQQYVLSYYPNDDRNDGRFRIINVRVTTRPNLRVRARKGYYALPNQRQAGLTGMSIQPAQQLLPDTGNELVGKGPAQLNNSINRTQGASSQDANGTTIFISTERDTGGRERIGPRGPTDDSADAVSEKRAGPNRRRGDLSAPNSTQPPAVAASSPSPTAESRQTTTQTPAPTQTESTTESKPARKQAEAEARPVESKSANSSAESKPADSKVADSKAAESKSSETKAAAQSPAAKAPLSGGVLNGKAVNLPKPVYPLAARSAGMGGTVVVEVLIDESGKVVSARAISGPTMLRGACVDAARQARFSPTVLSGQPVKVSGVIHYNFAQR